MLQTVLSCDCDCGCQSELKWGDDKWGARARDVARYGWDLSWPVRCPGCARWCNSATGITWWEVSLLLTAINRAEVPADSRFGRAIARLERRLTWLTRDNVRAVLKAEQDGVGDQGAGLGRFVINESFHIPPKE